MKEGWEVKELGDVCKVINGGTPKTKEKEYWNGDINWITPADLGKLDEVLVSETTRKITELGLQKSSAKLFKENSVILSTRAPIGHLAINTVPMSTNQGCRGLVPNKNLNTWYLYYFLKGNIQLLNDLGTGATFLELSARALKSVEIPIPSIIEQRRIVSILDHCFAAIDQAKANAEQNLQNAKELFESYLQGVFDAKKSDESGWVKNRLEELGVITSSKRIYKREYVQEGIPFYRTKEVKELAHNREITLELFISKERYKEIKNRFGVPQIGDLLISAVGTIGEILVIKDDQEFYFKDGNIIWLKDFDNIDTDYLKYALTAFVEKIKSLAIGAAYSALTIEKLKLYEIAFPESLKRQQEIVQKLDALQTETQKLETIYQKKIDDLEELKKSILQKAFAGELKTEKIVVEELEDQL